MYLYTQYLLLPVYSYTQYLLLSVYLYTQYLFVSECSYTSRWSNQSTCEQCGAQSTMRCTLKRPSPPPPLQIHFTLTLSTLLLTDSYWDQLLVGWFKESVMTLLWSTAELFVSAIRISYLKCTYFNVCFISLNTHKNTPEGLPYNKNIWTLEQDSY